MRSDSSEYPPYMGYAIATLMSVCNLAFQATIPFKLQILGKGLDVVGFLSTWTSLCYALVSVSFGWVSHRFGPRRVMVTTLLIFGVMALAIPWTTAAWQIYLSATVFYSTICLFWVAMEHASVGWHRQLTLIQSTAYFAVAFSLGNAIGQLSSSLLQRQTVSTPFFVAAGITVPVLFLTLRTVSAVANQTTAPAHAALKAEVVIGWQQSLWTARIGLLGTYGLYALICCFLPRYLCEVRQFSKPLAGGMVVITLLTMSLTFGVHSLCKGWPHRLWMVRLCPFVALGSSLLTGLATSVPVIVLGAVVLGIAAATSYTHHLYYSLEDPRHRARNAGIHEGVVGLAFMIPPALAGLAVRYTGAPVSLFWAGALFAVGVILAQNIFYLRSRPASTAAVV